MPGLPQMRLALRDARRQLMVGFEYVPRMVEQLTIAWMIDGLNRHDLFHEGRSVLPDVLDQLGLFIRRTGDQHRSRIGNRFGNTLEKCMILRRTPAPDAVGLVVEMVGRSVRVNDKLIRLVGAEMKYPRLPMIDPDNRMIMSHVTLAGSWATDGGRDDDAPGQRPWWFPSTSSRPGNLPWRRGRRAIAEVPSASTGIIPSRGEHSLGKSTPQVCAGMTARESDG